MQSRLRLAFPPDAPTPLQQAEMDVPRSWVYVNESRTLKAESALEMVSHTITLSEEATRTLCMCLSQAFLGDPVVGATEGVIAAGGDGVGELCRDPVHDDDDDDDEYEYRIGSLIGSRIGSGRSRQRGIDDRMVVMVDARPGRQSFSVTARKRLRAFKVDHQGIPHTMSTFVLALSVRVQCEDGVIVEAISGATSP